ncbi:SIT4 phosphatase-associated family protein isoform 3 [Hibiscus syriacus]|uniref:SIT4 phosphatase-associated family protein isoform 3 n=1 Tax=Hibiscus syriacus TaxID=106335 RepID=A0A6A2XB69_HIBSY|nr:SIT4 phosphatase-associated family protein isoform 3 [Hibiscus syriacus]
MIRNSTKIYAKWQCIGGVFPVAHSKLFAVLSSITYVVVLQLLVLILFGHQEIVEMVVDPIGITSIMEVLIRLIGADEHMYTNYMESMQWIEDTNILEFIVDKFSTLSAFNCLSIPKYDFISDFVQVFDTFYSFHSSTLMQDSAEVHANAAETLCAITRFAPPGLAAKISGPKRTNKSCQHAAALADGNFIISIPILLRIVELISVLLMVGSEAAEKELIQLGAVQRILNLFFEYPYNNFLHHLVENIILSCLESKNVPLPTVSAEGRAPPKIGNIGHLTRICNKLVQLGNSNGEIQAYLQENSEWIDWQKNVLSKRNVIENVYQWA